MPTLSDREQEEIRRSAFDALRRTESLVAEPTLFARYSNPPKDTPFYLEYSFHLLGDVRGKSVLDYGCGGGNAMLLAARGGHVTGIDISLDLEQARREVLRLLKPGGVLIMKEPVRDSRTYSFIRSLIPYRTRNNSEYEHPLREEEIDAFADGFQCEAKRRFRLPFVPLARIVSRGLVEPAFRVDGWILKTVPALEHFATVEVRKLRRYG